MAKGSGREAFSRTPDSVWQDVRLSSRDKAVYGGMSRLERRGMVIAGYRKISACCRVPFQKIGESLEKLIECGHVERRGEGYFLTSDIFRVREQKRSSGKGQRVSPTVRLAKAFASRGSLDDIFEGLAG